MNQQLEEFLDQAVDSTLRLELLLFLHNNQFAVDTEAAIAQRLGKSPEEVAQALEVSTGNG